MLVCGETMMKFFDEPKDVHKSCGRFRADNRGNSVDAGLLVVLGRFVKVVQRKPDRDGLKFAGGDVSLAEQTCEGHKRLHEHRENARALSWIRYSIGQGRIVLKRVGEYFRGRGDLVLAEPLDGWGCWLRCCHFALSFRMPSETLRILAVLVNGTRTASRRGF